MGRVSFCLGYAPESSLEPSFSKGLVSTYTPTVLTVSTHSDAGWRGGPTVDLDGALTGVILGGAGSDQRRTRAVSASLLNMFLMLNGKPPLSC